MLHFKRFKKFLDHFDGHKETKAMIIDEMRFVLANCVHTLPHRHTELPWRRDMQPSNRHQIQVAERHYPPAALVLGFMTPCACEYPQVSQIQARSARWLGWYI